MIESRGSAAIRLEAATPSISPPSLSVAAEQPHEYDVNSELARRCPLSATTLRMAIGTAPTLRPGVGPYEAVDLTGDMRLVKAALLYSDGATLYSPASSMLLSVLALGELAPEGQLDFIESVITIILRDPGEAARVLDGFGKYRKILRKKHPNVNQMRFKEQFESRLDLGGIRAAAEGFSRAPGFEDLASAVGSGLVEIHPFHDGESDKLVAEFVEILGRAISDGTEYPLFDSQTNDLVRAAIEEGAMEVSRVGVARGRHSGLAAHLLQLLPLFDEATVEEVLGIRRELESPLVRFRAAVIGYGEGIGSAAWDPDFVPEADLVYHRDVAPAVLEIREAVESNHYLKELAAKATPKAVAMQGGTLAVVVSKLSELPQAISGIIPGDVTIAGAAGAGLAAAKLAYEAREEWKRKTEAVQGSQLYFYYEAEKRLKRS